jgi:hypothetical protein
MKMLCNKKIKSFLLFSVIIFALSLMLPSCGSSKGCRYDASAYQVKNKRVGYNMKNKPSSFKHTSPIRKKWVIGSKKR